MRQNIQAPGLHPLAQISLHGQRGRIDALLEALDALPQALSDR